MFTNKHVIVAMIVAPILAVLAYFGTDAIVSETPQAAQQGQTYQLVAKPNCRYQSGVCGMQNGDVELDLQLQTDPQGQLRLLLNSNLPLQGAKLAWDNGDPVPLTATQQDAQQWQLLLAERPAKDAQLRLVVSINDSLYFAETGTVFFDYETIFGQDFRRGGN